MEEKMKIKTLNLISFYFAYIINIREHWALNTWIGSYVWQKALPITVYGKKKYRMNGTEMKKKMQ